MEKMRSPKIQLIFEGKDITRDITKYNLELTYTDYAHGKTDNVEIKLEDRDGVWKFGWFPEKGSSIAPSIEYEGQILKCGEFEIDEIEVMSPPDTITMKAVSAFISKDFRREEKNRSWENMSLKTIAGQIADEHGFVLFFDGEDTFFDKVSQKSESDLHLLKRLTEKEGLHLKINEEKIIIYEGKFYDEKPPVKKYTRGQSDIISFNFRSKASDIYRGCEVSCFDEKKKKLITYTYNVADSRVGQILKINKRAKSLAEAEKIAKGELRKKNKFEVEGDIEIVGDPKMLAGVNIALSGFGAFDGNYFVEQAIHAVSNGYRTTLRVRKVLCY